MAQLKRAQIKIYIVIGLVILALIVAYFRFFYKKGDTQAGPATPAASTALTTQITVPQVSENIRSTGGKEKMQPEASFSPVVRDIFAPLIIPSTTEPKPGALDQAMGVTKMGPNLSLDGTIVGRSKRLAIINGRFVRQGEMIGEYKVVSIGEKMVRLSLGSDIFELKMGRYD